jgi:hypothetical protein
MALARGLVPTVMDDMGTEHKLDVAHAIGLRRALAMLVTTRSGHALRGRLGRTHRGWRGRGGRVNAVDS